MEAMDDILFSRDEIAIGKLNRVVRVLGTANRCRAEGHRPRIFLDRDGLSTAVIIDSKGKIRSPLRRNDKRAAMVGKKKGG